MVLPDSYSYSTGVFLMKNTLFLIAILTLTVAVGGAQAAGNAAEGKSASARCAGCHGADGISKNSLWPNLAGQKEGYLAKQIRAFRDGARKDPAMSSMAKGLSDADIANLAAYFSSLKP